MQTQSPESIAVVDRPRSHLGWLAIPAVVLIMALIGLSASAEDRDEFEAREEEKEQQRDAQQGEGQPGQPGQGQPQPGQGQPGESQPGQGQPGEGQPGQSGQPGQGESDTIIITTEDGDVVVQVDENGNPIALVPIEGQDSGDLDSDFYVPSDTGRVVAPDPDGDVVGVRVTKQGRIETVDSDEIENDDFLFRESTERVALLRPDGSIITLEPTVTFKLQGTETNFNREQSPAIELAEVMIERTGIEQSSNLVAESPSDHPGVVIRTTGGPIRFDLDRAGNLIADIPTGKALEDATILGREDVPGLSVSDDGKVEITSPGERPASQEFIFDTQSDDLEIIRPDGRRIRLSSQDGELDGKRIFENGSDSTLKTRKTVLVASGDNLPSDSKIADDAEPLSMQTEQGLVRLDFDKDGNLIADQPNRDDITVIDPAEPSAIRVNEDGKFEVVPADEIRPGDAVLEPNGEGGFDLVRPDGSRVEFRPDGENGGMSATEISPDGTETELTPNEDGSVTLEDGTEIGAIDQPEDSGPIERLIESTSEMPWVWLLGGFSLLAALSIGTAFYLHRNRPDDPFDYSLLVSEGQMPRDRFEEFLAMLQADSNPTRAVRLGFAVAESGMGGIPRKKYTETPFEWQERVASQAVHQAKTVEVICDLFARARFAPAESSEADRSEMISQLRLLHQQFDGGARASQFNGGQFSDSINA